MTAKSDELINELISAGIAFGRQVEPDWQTRIEKARQALREYIAELTAHSDIERQDDKWIPVSERLPEDGEVVWLWDGNNLGMGYYLIFSGCFMDRDAPLRSIKPTHWMSLPSAPESEDE
jgi:hypothetical protein